MNATQAFINQLNDEIAKLTKLKEQLPAWLLSDSPGLPTPVVQTSGARPTKAKAVKKVKGGGNAVAAPDVAAAYRREMHPEESAPTATRSGRAPSGDYLKVLAQARTAPEPFTAASLGVNTGVDVKFCANKLFAWQQKGWLVKAGRGEFKRTKDFPAAAPDAE